MFDEIEDAYFRLTSPYEYQFLIIKDQKMLKRQSQALNRKRTENTTAKINMTNGKTTIYKLLHRKLKIEQQEPH